MILLPIPLVSGRYIVMSFTSNAIVVIEYPLDGKLKGDLELNLFVSED